MIKQINNIIRNLIKPEYDLILDNLISNLEKEIFRLYYVEKYSKKEVEKELNITEYKLKRNLESIRSKISKIPQFNCKFKCDDTTENRLRERCRKLGKSKEYEEFCVYAFIQHLKNKEIADIMYLDEETVRKYKIKRRKELEN